MGEQLAVIGERLATLGGGLSRINEAVFPSGHDNDRSLLARAQSIESKIDDMKQTQRQLGRRIRTLNKAHAARLSKATDGHRQAFDALHERINGLQQELDRRVNARTVSRGKVIAAMIALVLTAASTVATVFQAHSK